MSSKKLSNNFTHSIRELTLIVLGIIIALQLNNWNENNKKRQVEIQYLEQLRSDLLSTKQELIEDLKWHVVALDCALKIQLILNSAEPFPDSLAFDFYIATEDTQLFPESAAYESLKSGGLSIISNDSLRIRLIRLYETYIERVVSRGEDRKADRDLLKQYFELEFNILNNPKRNRVITFSDTSQFNIPVEVELSGKTISPHPQFIPLTPKNFRDLKSNRAFAQVWLNLIGRKGLKIRNHEDAIAEINSVVEFVNNEIDKDSN